MRRIWDKSKPPVGPYVLNKDSLQAQGLLVWWPFDGASSSGLLPDMAGQVNAHATNAGTLATGWTGTPFGHKAIKFNGTNNYFSTASGLLNFTKTTPFMVAWTGDFGTRGPVTCWNAGVSGGWQVDQDRAAGYTSLLISEFNGSHSIGRDIGSPGNDSAIRSKMFVYDGSVTAAGITSYVDGVLTNGTTFTNGTADPGVLTDSGLYIGYRRGGPGYYTTSTLADIRIYNSIVNAAAIALAIADPATKFELWYPLRSKKWISIAVTGSTITTATLPAGVGAMGSGQTRAIQPSGVSYMG